MLRHTLPRAFVHSPSRNLATAKNIGHPIGQPRSPAYSLEYGEHQSESACAPFGQTASERERVSRADPSPGRTWRDLSAASRSAWRVTAPTVRRPRDGKTCNAGLGRSWRPACAAMRQPYLRSIAPTIDAVATPMPIACRMPVPLAALAPGQLPRRFARAARPPGGGHAAPGSTPAAATGAPADATCTPLSGRS